MKTNGVCARRRLTRVVLAALLVVPLLSGGGKAPAASRPSQPFADSPQRVWARVSFTAVDKSGAAVTTLTHGDVRVFVDGEPQPLTAFVRQADAPLALAFLIDVSASQERVLPATKRAAVAFLSTTLRDGLDRVAVVSFTGSTTLEQELTGDLSKARRGVEGVKFTPPAGYVGGGVVVSGPGGHGKARATMQGATALWDAVSATCEEVLTPAKKEGERRVIVLLTDGVDTSSVMKVGEATRGAVKAETVVYAVGIGDEDFSGVEKGDLRKLAERTGGRAFFPKKQGEVLAIFEQMRQELSAQYVASFVPQKPVREGSFQQLRVELVNPELRRQGIRLAHAEAYFAGGAANAPQD